MGFSSLFALRIRLFPNIIAFKSIFSSIFVFIRPEPPLDAKDKIHSFQKLQQDRITILTTSEITASDFKNCKNQIAVENGTIYTFRRLKLKHTVFMSISTERLSLFPKHLRIKVFLVATLLLLTLSYCTFF